VRASGLLRERVLGRAQRERVLAGARRWLGLGRADWAGGVALLAGPARAGRGRGWVGPDWAAGKEMGRVVLGLGYGFLFYFFFFCKLTQTSLNPNKFEFKLPSTQPK